MQLKGGDAREPSESDVVRLWTVAAQIGATRVVPYLPEGQGAQHLPDS